MKISEDLSRAADVLQSMQLEAQGDLAPVSSSPNIPPAVFGAGGRQGSMSVARYFLHILRQMLTITKAEAVRPVSCNQPEGIPSTDTTSVGFWNWSAIIFLAVALCAR